MKRIILLIPLLAILSVFSGCKTKTVLVPADRVKIEYRDRLRVDSVYNRDTVIPIMLRWATGSRRSKPRGFSSVI